MCVCQRGEVWRRQLALPVIKIQPKPSMIKRMPDKLMNRQIGWWTRMENPKIDQQCMDVWRMIKVVFQINRAKMDF